MESPTKATVNEIPKEKETPTGNERSTIEFPYSDLDNAIEVVRGVHAVGGTACDYDQLAAHMRLEAKGGGFRIRVTSAKSYGLLTYERGGRTTLTELGIKIIDPQSDRAAKIEAFLRVPLFAKVFEEFKGRQLPPQAGLERAMISYGVGSKVAKNARQVLLRSAKQAGYFDLQPDRLTQPPTRDVPPSGQTPLPNEKPNENAGGGGNNGGGGGEKLHPFIEGLLKTLPPPDTKWPIASRLKWLQAASNIFDLIYESGQTGDSEGVEYIEITKKAI